MMRVNYITQDDGGVYHLLISFFVFRLRYISLRVISPSHPWLIYHLEWPPTMRTGVHRRALRTRTSNAMEQVTPQIRSLSVYDRDAPSSWKTSLSSGSRCP